MKKRTVYLIIFFVIFLSKATFINDSLYSSEDLASSKASIVQITKDAKGDWRLIVNGQPYFIRGVVYSVAKVGESPDAASLRDWMVVDDNGNGKIDGPYDAFVDINKNNSQDEDEPAVGDFQLLKDMGCNTIRLYHHASASEAIKGLYNNPTLDLLYNHEPNKELLRDLYYRYGIMVMVGDFLGAHGTGSGADYEKGTDYSDPKQQENMIASVRQMVLDFRDEPFLLLYCIGNENNLISSHTNARLIPETYAAFVNRVARIIHELDPNHPVVLCQGGDGQIGAIAKYAPEIDIFGLNYYSLNGSFGNLWTKVKKRLDKPILITEYGNLHVVPGGESFEDRQLEYHRRAWEELYNNLAGGTGEGNALGGFIFEWLDNWWQGGQPCQQNEMNEYLGISSQGNGSNSPYLRQLRKVYYYYKSAWSN